MVDRPYGPDVGDLAWLTFDPQADHEQGGRWPALILSPRVYNSKSPLALAYPITSQSKGYPFELAIPPGQSVAGVVLADYINNLNWRVRKAAFESKAPAGVVAEVRERLMPLLGF